MDLTKFRQKSITDRSRTLSSEQAAGAMGFAANDWENKDEKSAMFGDSGSGNPLAPILLRLKYADDRSSMAFVRAQILLFNRTVTDPRKRASQTLYAVTRAALFEWVHDACSKCRVRKAGAPKAQPCLACGQFRETVPWLQGTREVVLGHPDKECTKCFGIGRIFPKIKDPKGMRCAACGNTGRHALASRQRWKLVTKYLPGGLDYRIFANRWMKTYQKFLDVLRAEDKRIANSIDIQLTRLDNADTEPRPEKEDIAPSDESDSGVRQPLQDGGETAP